MIDQTVSDYEAALGAILNFNRKSVVLGPSSWVRRTDWPPQWIQTARSIKLFGVHFTPTFATTLQLSWEHTVGALRPLSGCGPPDSSPSSPRDTKSLAPTPYPNCGTLLRFFLSSNLSYNASSKQPPVSCGGGSWRGWPNLKLQHPHTKEAWVLPA